MIYRVLYDGIDIHTNSVPDVLINPTVETEMNTAGSFTFTLPPDHFAWGDIYVFKGNVEVYENNDLIFFGRVANVDQNWNNERVVECEGALAFFNDSIQRPNSWTSNTLISKFLSDILDNHNAQVPDNRKIYLGNVTIDDMYVTRETNYEKTLDVLTRMCIDTNGGYFSLRKDENDGKIYLDWLKDLTDIAAQPVEFGLNLLDISRSLHAEDIVTGVLARGGEVNDVKIDLHEVGEIDDPSIPVIHHTNQDPDILWHRDGLEGYGRVVQVKEFNDCTTVDGDNGLLAKATEWLIKQNTDIDTIEVDAAELGYFGESYPIFLLGQKVLVNSHPHHLENVELPMYKISMNLDSGTKRISIGTPPKRELTQISASNMGGGSGSGSSSGGGSGSGGVQDVRVNGTSVVQDGIARVNVPTDTVTESEMNTAISTAVSGKANQSDLESLATTVAGKANTSEVTAALALKADKTDIPEIEANPSDAATDTLNKIDIEGTVYQLAGGTQVEANPVEAATDDLETIKIGNTVYDIPGSGGGSTNYGKFKCDVLFNTPTTTSTWANPIEICTEDKTKEYNMLYVVAHTTYVGQPSTFMIMVSEIGQYADSYFLPIPRTNSNVSSQEGYVWLSFESSKLKLYTDNKTITLDKVYGLKFENKLINRSDIYSEEERIIGRWTDGKLLYQKTYKNLGINLPASTWTSTGITFSDIDYYKVISNKSYLSDVQSQYPMLYRYYQGTFQAFCQWQMPLDELTIQYTKTTDAPGSGFLPEDPQMVMMSDYYSEDEQVVGRWTDGKPLYQKTVHINGSFGPNVYDVTVFDASSLNIDNICFSFATVDNGTPIPYAHPDIRWVANYYVDSNKIFKVCAGTSVTMTNMVLTFQYTKTTDAPGTGPTPGNLIYLPALYSEEEREVGVWTDGKPVYQKTFKPTSALTNGSWNSNILGTSGSGISIKNVDGLFYGSGYPELKFPLSYYRNDSEFSALSTNHTGDDINLLPKVDDVGTLYVKDVTVQYTKTTDQPGSGKYLPDGQLAHHYSTSEKVVGTWIDGSTIYERTWSGLSYSTSSSWTNFVTVPNGKHLIKANFYGEFGTDLYEITAEESHIDSATGILESWFGLNSTRTVKVITLRYTKSS